MFGHLNNNFKSLLLFHLFQVPDETVLSSELLVLNLPMGKDVTQVRNRLKKLSDNCGGKVVSISGRTSVLRFPNPASAAR